MTTVNLMELKNEIVRFLRNKDVLTITQRSVTTSQDTGTFASDSSHLINDSQIKNIRSIVIAGNTKVFGTDYTYDLEFDDSGTKKCKITFTVAETGAYTITYDTGPCSIFPDFPISSLALSSYPRIAVEQITGTTEPFGIGGDETISDFVYTIVVYAETTKQVENILSSIRQAVIENQTAFFYHDVVHPTGMGPILPKDNAKAKVFHRNIDIISRFKVEN